MYEIYEFLNLLKKIKLNFFFEIKLFKHMIYIEQLNIV